MANNITRVKLFSRQATKSICDLLEELGNDVNNWLKKCDDRITVVRCEHQIQSAGSTHESTVTVLIHYTCAPDFEG